MYSVEVLSGTLTVFDDDDDDDVLFFYLGMVDNNDIGYIGYIGYWMYCTVLCVGKQWAVVRRFNIHL